MEEIIRAGMAEIKIAKTPGKVAALGLGSCVAICAYDPVIKVGGIAHIMLPHSSMAHDSFNPAKFADTAIPLLIDELKKSGVDQGRLVINLVGGAEMFSFEGHSEHLCIGGRNIEAVEAVIKKIGLKVANRCLGGNTGKSVTLDLNDGTIEVKTVNGIVTL